MLPLQGKHRWMFAAILLYGIFVKNSTCDSTDQNNTCRLKNVLVVSAKEKCVSFSRFVNDNESKFCFCTCRKKCGDCPKGDFNFNYTITCSENNCNLILKEETLSKQDIVLMSVPDHNFTCQPSEPNNTNQGFFLNITKGLNTGVKNIRLQQNNFCGKSLPYDEHACKGLAETEYKITILNNNTYHCLSCKQPGKKPDISITVPAPESIVGTSISPEHAADIMKNISYLVEKMGNSSTAAITIGNNTGVITKLPQINQLDIKFGITTSGDMNILENNNDSVTGFSRSVQIPKEASAMAVKTNSSFAAVLLFPGMHQDNPNSFFLNNEVVAIEMGKEISNLSHTIDIHYSSVDKNGRIASCRSWSGNGKEAIWIQDGCQTTETNDSITCQCSHLTFFAILMSPPSTNISSSDFRSLTYITSIGCGLSIFFLTVALFMHCLISKRKASQATKVLVNLFMAMFTLNLSFLVNESIANLGNFAACVAMAATMHYTMLATFTWFFMQALHLYFILWKLQTKVKHYMMKICITGWVTPAVVVIALLASKQYNYLSIYTDDGNSAKMCWIPDADVHQGVNIGYYAVVFIFTFVVFVTTLRQIVLLKPKEGKGQDNGSIKTKYFFIVGMFLLLGFTWGFAFFSYGPLLIASYYIFTILNSFQGFFLVIYYFTTRKIVEDDRSPTDSLRSTAISNSVVTATHR